MRRFIQSILSGLALVAMAPTAAHANEITFFTTIPDTDYVTAAVGLRDVGTGSVTVSGVTGPVTQALLFWHGPTNSPSPTANANVEFNGTSIMGANIGFSDDNFWGMDNSQAYRADVTALVSGNGTYTLDDFEKPGVSVNGASLFVFFNDANPANDRDFVLFNGNDANFSNVFDPAGWDVTLSGINYSGGPTNFVTYVSDGQNFGPDDDGTLRVNGMFLASGGLFQGLAPRAPGAGVSNGSLTDIVAFDITSFMTMGPNTLNVTLDEGVEDALSLIVAGIDLPAGAAPTQEPPVIPEPTSVLLLTTGLAAAGIRRLRNRRGP